MKKQKTSILLAGLIVAALIVLTAFRNRTEAPLTVGILANDSLKKEVFTILNTKCNSCHRKQNPFMVFKEKTLERRAAKIYKAVFLDRRMPKGNGGNLSINEYAKLETWLLTQIQN